MSPKTKAKPLPTLACPHCEAFKSDTSGHVTSFLAGVVRHWAPDIWLGARSSRYASLGAVQSFLMACRDWAEGCELAKAAIAARTMCSDIKRMPVAGGRQPESETRGASR